MKQVVILGGGISGLGTAYYLSRYDYSPLIIEKEPALGGIASSYKINDFWIEKYYHHYFLTDKNTQRLIKELKLKYRWNTAKMACFYKGKVYPFTSPIDLLFFKPLSFFDRVKFGINVLKTSRVQDFEQLDKISAEKWFIKNWGEGIYKKLFKPLLSIKFGSSIDEISAAFASSRIRTRAKSGTAKGERFGYIEGGFQELFDALQEKLDGNSIYLNSEIIEVQKLQKNFLTKFRKNKKVYEIKSDYVINTLPLPVFTKIAKNFPEDFINQLKRIKYEAVICLILGLKKRLTKFYWTNVISPKMPFGGIIEHTNFIPPENYKRNHIIYIFEYLQERDANWKISDKELINLYTHHLSEMFPNFKKEDVLWSRVSRDKYATPIFTVNYSSVMPRIKTKIKGLYLCGSFQVYPFDRNINTLLNLSAKTTKIILKDTTA